MIRKCIASVCFILMAVMAPAQDGRGSLRPRIIDRPGNVPAETEVCGGVPNHVQGIAVDMEKGYMYFSFTTRFVKTDMHGHVIGSIDRIQGHLGALTLGPDGKVYASLECKDDAIGLGIARSLGVKVTDESKFYVAIIDVDKVDRTGIDPEGDPVLRTACLADPCRDYAWAVGGLEHRYGCSGIDGVTFAPAPGRNGRMLLYVAYGIYGDVTRPDNDYQVLLCYDPEQIDRTACPVTFGTLHARGPGKPLERYFVYTGNTVFGVQNLAYDPFTGTMMMAVYRGKKPGMPNYSFFAADMEAGPFKAPLAGVPYERKRVKQLRLAPLGLCDGDSGLRGWHFKWGSTGLFPLGNGYYAVSENFRDPVTRIEWCRVHLMLWTGDSEQPFAQVRDLSVAFAG